MANESSAFGTITFEAYSLTDLSRLVNLFSETMCQNRHVYYATEVDEPFREENALMEKLDNGRRLFSFVSPFYGIGRWGYATNADNMGSWFNNTIDFFSSERKDILREAQRLRCVPWTIRITCECDLEEGCQVLESFEAECTHLAGKNIGEMATNFIRRDSYDYTAKNLQTIAEDERAWDLSPEYVDLAVRYAEEQDVLDWLGGHEGSEYLALKKDLSEFLIKECPDINAGCPYIDELWDVNEKEQLRGAARKWMNDKIDQEMAD